MGNLEILLKNPKKTSNAIDLIQEEIKKESINIYNEVFKDFKGDYQKEYKSLKSIAEEKIEIKNTEIRNKHFNNLR